MLDIQNGRYGRVARTVEEQLHDTKKIQRKRWGIKERSEHRGQPLGNVQHIFPIRRYNDNASQLHQVPFLCLLFLPSDPPFNKILDDSGHLDPASPSIPTRIPLRFIYTEHSWYASAGRSKMERAFIRRVELNRCAGVSGLSVEDQ